MPADKLPFEYSGGKGHNTRIDYAFRDGDIVVRDSIIIEGAITEDQASELAGYLLDGKYFKPEKLMLPDLLAKMPSDWEEKDECPHEIERIGLTTRNEADFAPSAEQLLLLAENAELPVSWNTEQTLS